MTINLFGYIFIYSVANDGKWETIEKHQHIRRHIFCFDAVTSNNGLKGWNIIFGKRKLAWAKLNQ